jgi:hypothetical protein
MKQNAPVARKHSKAILPIVEWALKSSPKSAICSDEKSPVNPAKTTVTNATVSLNGNGDLNVNISLSLTSADRGVVAIHDLVH